MSNLTHEEIVRRGIKAQWLLDQEVFQEIIEEVKQLLSDQMFSTSPDQWRERDQIYNQRIALDYILGLLDARTVAGEEVQRIEEFERMNGDE